MQKAIFCIGFTQLDINDFYLEKICSLCYNQTDAGMVKLANTLDLGSSGAILAGSSPVTRTKSRRHSLCLRLFLKQSYPSFE